MPRPTPDMPRARGFTLIEMIIVVMIVGILASAAMPLAALHKRRAQEAELRLSLRTLRTALDAHKKAWDAGKIERHEGESGYPSKLSDLMTGVIDITDAGGKKLYFLRRIPRDPFADPQLPAHETWGLRSYASLPDTPQPGADVFDVYSLAPGQGLDGTAYRGW